MLVVVVVVAVMWCVCVFWWCCVVLVVWFAGRKVRAAAVWVCGCVFVWVKGIQWRCARGGVNGFGRSECRLCCAFLNTEAQSTAVLVLEGIGRPGRAGGGVGALCPVEGVGVVLEHRIGRESHVSS